jgi:hypothetical protein
MFWDSLSVPSSWVKESKTLEDGTNMLSQNIGSYQSMLPNILEE